ncbi:MAG: class I SAM-dependent methyltransferase [Candidatus Melainabacteria bacterium]|nr:class I SAM-dependent methyltransferase [Candidatus Melainabacteria bacterium]
MPGLKEKLENGIKVADVGCGHGLSTIILAKEYPNSTFFGFDNHPSSIERAIESAEREGVSDRVKFACTDAGAFTGSDYDLVAYFDCLHDMGDPVSSCKRAVETLKSDGCAMIIEPMAGATIEENFNLVGRVFSGASVLCCTPNAVASGKHSLGTIATDDALSEVAKAGGFSSFRRVVSTPFNRVFEAKP